VTREELLERDHVAMFMSLRDVLERVRIAAARGWREIDAAHVEEMADKAQTVLDALHIRATPTGGAAKP
jgi:hypothetical protein